MIITPSPYFSNLIIFVEEVRDAGFMDEMIVYDVGGSRTQRNQWMSYFEDSAYSWFRKPAINSNLK